MLIFLSFIWVVLFRTTHLTSYGEAKKIMLMLHTHGCLRVNLRDCPSVLNTVSLCEMSDGSAPTVFVLMDPHSI